MKEDRPEPRPVRDNEDDHKQTNKHTHTHTQNPVDKYPVMIFRMILHYTAAESSSILIDIVLFFQLLHVPFRDNHVPVPLRVLKIE